MKDLEIRGTPTHSRRLAERTRVLAVLPCLAIAGLLAASCGSNLLATPPNLVDADSDLSTCGVAKDPLNPFIIEWPGTNKVTLEWASKRGVVAVSYSNCTLKVLPDCKLDAEGYSFGGVTPTRDEIRMENETDLYARLPLGASGLKAELGGGTRLSFKYVAVGVRATEATPTLPDAGCDEATHFIRAITVGAYELDAEASANASVGVDLPIASAGASRREGAHRLRASGDLAGCSEQSRSQDAESIDTACLAPLQLTLVPLRRARGQSATTKHENPQKRETQLPAGARKVAGGTCVRTRQGGDADALKLADAAINEDYIGADMSGADEKLDQALELCRSSAASRSLNCSCQVMGKIFVAKATLDGLGRSDMDAAKQHLLNAFKADADVQPLEGLNSYDFHSAWNEARREVRGR